MKRIISIFIVGSFFVNSIMGPSPVYAQEFRLPAPGVMVNLSPPLNPPILKGIKVHPDNPFRFEFILDQGDSSVIPAKAGIQNQEQLKTDSTRLIKYFLASLTIPDKDLWVNLSPYERNRIIPESFGQTEMGRDLLAEDYMLKQITASLVYPEGETGKKFWKRIYEEAAKKFGTTNIPVNTFNKVWIVPEKAVVFENPKSGTAYIIESKLKVMLEQDYLALSHGVIPAKARIQNKNDINALGSQIVREIVIPELTREVNEDKNFIQLRQVYNSLILATWYKKKIKDSILNLVYANRNKVAGVNISDPQEDQKIYERYLRAYKKGVYNYIKEGLDPVTQEIIPRKYFSGGVDVATLPSTLKEDRMMDSKAVDAAQAEPLAVVDALVGTPTEATPIDREQKDPLAILSSTQGRALAQEWVSLYPNENNLDTNHLIPDVIQFLSDHRDQPDLVAQTIKAFPMLDQMHQSYKGKTQPTVDTPAYELPAVVGKETLLRPFVQGPNLLNVGSGLSLFEERSLNLNPAVVHAIGVDIEAQRKTPLIVPEGKTYAFWPMTDPSRMPDEVKDGWANTVVMTFVLHHVDVDRLNYLIEVRKKMAPGAVLLVVEDTFSDQLPIEPEGEFPQEISESFARLQTDQERIMFLHFVDWFVHNFVNRSREPLVPGNYESMETWKSLFEQAGFIVEEERNLGFSKLGSRNPVSRGYFVLRKPDQSMTSERFNRLAVALRRKAHGEELLDIDGRLNTAFSALTLINEDGNADQQQRTKGILDAIFEDKDNVRSFLNAGDHQAILCNMQDANGVDFIYGVRDRDKKREKAIENWKRALEGLEEQIKKIKLLDPEVIGGIDMRKWALDNIQGVIDSLRSGIEIAEGIESAQTITLEDVLKIIPEKLRAKEKFIIEGEGYLSTKINGNPLSIASAIYNLIINSHLAVKEQQQDKLPIVTLKLSENSDGELVIELSDNGPGIPQHLRDPEDPKLPISPTNPQNIFKLNMTSRENNGGSGLGAAEAYYVTHGRIFAENLPGGGAIVTMRFKKDLAMKVTVPHFLSHGQALKEEEGGIDFTAANMNLQTRSNGGEIKFHIDAAMLARLQNAPGFVPTIIKIQPMVNLRMFLGINDPVGVDKSL